MNSYALLFTAIALGVVGQLLLKRGMSRRPGFRLTALLALIREPEVVGGFVAYGASVLLYLRALATLPLSIAYPTVSLGYVFVIILSRLFLNERITGYRAAAVATICAGVTLVGFGSR